MRSFNASMGFVMAGLFMVALLSGCSDDAKPAGTKPATGAGNKASDTKSIDSAEATAKPSGSLTVDTDHASVSPKETRKQSPSDVAKPDATPAVKTEAKPEAKTEAKPEVKAEPKPPEGKVEVKAVPDSEMKDAPSAEVKPTAKVNMAKEASPTSTAASSDEVAPKFSTFASADDLAAELKILIADLEKAVASEDEYKSQVEGRFTRDGNTVALVAIALGLHDQDNPLKPTAKAITAAAVKLAQAKDFASTTQAVADLKGAVDGKGAGGDELKWAKVATLNNLMKDQVSNINTKLKTSIRHFKKRSADLSANAAAMALIAENAKLYLGDTKKPAEGAKWTEFTDQMRSAASEVAAKAHVGDEEGAKAALDKLNQSCHNCHAVFNPEGSSDK